MLVAEKAILLVSWEDQVISKPVILFIIFVAISEWTVAVAWIATTWTKSNTRRPSYLTTL